MRCLIGTLIAALLTVAPAAGQAKSSAEDLARAREIFETLLQKTPDDPDVYRYLGDVYAASGDPKRAQSFYLEAAARSPGDYYPLYRVGELLWAADKRAEAKGYFERALPLIPPETEELSAQLAFARAAALLGDTPRSDARYEELLAAHPGSAEVVGSRIDTLVDTGRFKAARSLAESAHEEHPSDPALCRSLARTMVLTRDYAGARDLLNPLLQKSPDDADLRADFANLLYQSGEWDRAWPLYEALAAEFPSNDDYRKVLDDLFRDHRPRLSGSVDGMLNGNDRRYGPAFAFLSPIDARWAFEADYFFHRDSTTIPGYNPSYWTPTQSLNLLAHYRPHRTLALSAGVANQMVGSSYFPAALFGADWDHPAAGRFTLDFFYNEMFDDPVAALFFGGREDAVGVAYEKTLFNRVVLFASYRSIWYRIDGATTGMGGGNDFGRADYAVPGVWFILLHRPDIRLGYEFIYNHLHIANNYLSIIPLIQNQRQHTILVSISHEWTKWLTLDVGGFVGNDSMRNLYLKDLDLYGFNVIPRFKVSKRFELAPHYEYSSESQQLTTGRYQYFGLDFLYRF